MISNRQEDESRRMAAWPNAVAAAFNVAGAMPQSELRQQATQLETLNTLAAFIASDALQKLGLFRDMHSSQAADQIVAQGAVIGEQRRAFFRLIAIAVESALIVEGPNGHYDRRRAWIEQPSASDLSIMRARFAGNADLFDLVVGFGHALPDILTGRVHAAEMLFRDGLMSVATRLYSEAPPFRYCNDVALVAASAFAQETAGEAGLHLVEIGAGTGATTKVIVGGRTAGIGRYLFTDVSNFFLTNARHAYADLTFMDYDLLDIEAPVREELRGTFEIAIAAHVLHATRRIDETLRHVRSLLKSGGMLILLEETSMQPFFSVTMGTQTGFDRFEDISLRTDHPLLSAEQWERRAQQAGFRRFAALTEIMGIRPMLLQA